MKLRQRFSGRLGAILPAAALIAALCGCHNPGDCVAPPTPGPAGPAPVLGAAAPFGAFAAATLTNTGPSVVNADIGLTPGTSVTGFPPGIINGTLHINDAVATQAKLDAQAA